MQIQTNEKFPVKPGVGVFVPHLTIRRASREAAKHPETPILYLLSSKNTKGGRHFKEDRGGRGHELEGGFHLFAPEATKSGDLLIIEWVTRTCAGARLATAAELEAVRRVQIQEAQQAARDIA